MEARKKRAWIYTHIDAPDDSHGMLDRQYEQLNSYADRMGFEVIGNSSDVGGGDTLLRPGLQSFLDESGNGMIEVLLVADSTKISCDTARRKEFVKQMEECWIEVFSPEEGEIHSDDAI